MKSFRVCFLSLLLAVFSVLQLFVEVDAKTKRPKPKFGRKVRNSDTVWTGVYYCCGGLALMFVPLLGYFLYNLYKDPEMPKVFSELLELAKKRTLGYLSSKPAEKTS